MSELSEFLLARIAEDEDVARAAVRWSEGASQWADADEPDWIHIARWDPARVLAECEAKRRIVEIHAAGEHMCPSAEALEDGLWSVSDQDVMTPCPTLRLLALPYADHSEYRSEWAP